MVDTDKAERISRAVDWERLVVTYGGDEEMALEMCRKADEISFNNDLDQLYKALIESDYNEMRIRGYNLKCLALYYQYFDLIYSRLDKDI